MRIRSVSFGFSTDKFEDTKQYYQENFNAKIVFEAEGYMNIMLGDLPVILEFSSPTVTGVKASDPAGLGFNIEVEDAEKVYYELVEKAKPSLYKRAFKFCTEINGCSLGIMVLRV